DSLKVAAGLLSDFGLSSATLSANSVLIPIAYYVHRRGLTQKYRESVADASDRAALRSWTLRSLIMPGIWGSGLDSLLRDLRQTISDQGADGFPSAELEKRMAARGKSLAVTAEQVEDILGLTYGAARTFAVLAVLFPHVNTRNIHHVDHVFPQALLTKANLKQAGFDPGTIEDLQTMRDQLPNLQMLEGSENISKSATLPSIWAANAYKSSEALQAYLDRNQIPWLPASVNEFESFFAERRSALAQHIIETLSGPAGSARASDGDRSIEPEPSLNASIDEELATTVSEGNPVNPLLTS
ncbi:MAG TPA: DUF262 domain-containing protein, partial [Sinomonas sp.]|nr:DUF262 domain-containing protein [Sinomonas sp.]